MSKGSMESAELIRSLGQAALTVIPLLAAVLFGLIELWRNKQVIRRGTFTRLRILLAMLGGNLMLWLALDFVVAVGYNPQSAERILRIASIVDVVLLLVAGLLLIAQILELIQYTMRAAGHQTN